MVIPERNFSSEDYRFGFNSKEKDDEVKGGGNSLNFGARIYDPRIARWMSIDPEISKFPSWSAYTAFNNSPINIIDKTGRGGEGVIEGNEFVIYIHVVFYGEIANQNPALATTVSGRVSEQLNAGCTQVMIQDQNYDVRYVITSEVRTTSDALILARNNKGENYDPKLNFISIHNTSQPNSNTNSQELDARDHKTVTGGLLGGDNSATLKLKDIENPYSTSQTHELLHWLIGRYKGVHDDGPLVKGEVPHMMMTGTTDVTNASSNYVEMVQGRITPTLNRDKRIYTQENASNLDIYSPTGNSFQVGSSTNVLFDDSGKEIPSKSKAK